MGNSPHHRQQKIQQQLSQLTLISKNKNYSILQDSHKKSFIKFLYISNQKEDTLAKQYHSKSIFDYQYLTFRYNWQMKYSEFDIPKILAFGQEDQPNQQSMLVCSLHKLNYVIFQHPVKSLKTLIQERITSSDQFQQIQFLTLIKSCIKGLIQLQGLQSQYIHYENGNRISSKKKYNLTLNEENIFVDLTSERFIISDLTNFMENHQFIQTYNNEKTVRSRQRNNSKHNLIKSIHDDKSQKINSKQLFYQRNLQSLVLIIESLIFKFQCLNISDKNSITQSASISTALESHRAYSSINNKNGTGYSFEFQNLLKLVQRYDNNQEYLLEIVENMLGKFDLKQSKIKFQYNKPLSRQLSRQNSHEKNLKNVYSLEKIHKISTNINIHSSLSLLNHKNQQKIKLPLKQTNNNSNNILIKDINNQQRKRDHSNKNHTKIRLSLRKNNNFADKENIIPLGIQKKNSLTLNLNLLKDQQAKKSCQQQLSEKSCKQNKILGIKINDFNKLVSNSKLKVQQEQTNNHNKLKKRSQSLKILDVRKKNHLNVEQINTKEKQKKKVFLKKAKIQQVEVSKINQGESNKKSTTKNKQNQPEHSYHHLNPITKKRNINNRHNPVHHINHKLTFQSDKYQNQGQHQYIENLSSIISNPNNTLSSYGNPLTITDEFKTQNSDIQEQGSIQFNQISEQIKYHKKAQGQFNNDNNIIITLPSLPSIQMVESIIQKPEDRIPQFLKQFKLPEKHLLALNNIILKQKDVIVEESFEQSDLNSFRKSIPNLLTGNFTQTTEQLKKRKSKILEEFNAKIIQNAQNEQNEQRDQQLSMISEDSVTHGLKVIQNSLNYAMSTLS